MGSDFLRRGDTKISAFDVTSRAKASTSSPLPIPVASLGLGCGKIASWQEIELADQVGAILEETLFTTLSGLASQVDTEAIKSKILHICIDDLDHLVSTIILGNSDKIASAETV